jgi:PAS domain S-box-containing protein
MSHRDHDSAILRAIMTTAVDAIIVSDATGNILRASPAAEYLFGFEEGELIGRDVKVIMPDEMAHRHDSFMTRYIQTGEKQIIGSGRQVEGRRKNGQVFPVLLSVGEAREDDSQIFVAILHDDTRRVTSEAALSRSQRMDAIGQMTGGISHDFNNLLTVIIGNLELLEMNLDNDRQLALSREALHAAEMAAELTSRLMVFARQGNLKPAPSDLSEICRSAMTLLERMLGSKYTIATEFTADASPALVDPVQLETALVNLALNSRDAMPEGGELLISVSDIIIDDRYMAQEADVSPGHYVRILFTDNGHGMTEDAQKRAFEPFFTTKAESHGTGLGLAMVYGFVRQSGGHITLYSEVGYGTSFGLYFPAALSGADVLEAPPAPIANIPPRGYIPCILVVEDNAKVRKNSLERLTALGYRILSAETADNAYEMLKSGTPVDLVFTDVIMPGKMTGFDLAAKIFKEFPRVKVLLTSGYASDVFSEKIPQEADYDILQKPYRQSHLATRIQTLLDDKPD